MTAIAPALDKIYQPSDLNQGYRAILDEAREGSNPRVRDKDGTGIVVVLEQEFDALTALTTATASYILLDRAVAHRTKDEAPSLAEFGDWTWLRHFDRDDLVEFLGEIGDALVVANRERTFEPVRVVLRDWMTTANALADPLRRQILLGDPQDEDFVEVARPVSPEKPA